MKKLIILSIMSACLMSFAQTSALSVAQPNFKKAIVGFEHAPTQKNIWIVDNKASLFAQAALKAEMEKIKAEAAKSVNGLEKKIDFTGWQPEVSDLVNSISGIMNEVSLNLGASCNKVTVASIVQNADVHLTDDIEIDLSQLSEVTQACLRK
jgi:hypothetical protein